MKDLMLKNLEVLIVDIKLENQKQIDKWGIQDHVEIEWFSILSEEFGELAISMNSYWFSSETEPKTPHIRHIIQEATQLATLTLKIMEMFYELYNKEIKIK